ncbi:MAG: glycoside hydrolase 100 family protein [Cyanobacteria bacterium J06641_5]
MKGHQFLDTSYLLEMMEKSIIYYRGRAVGTVAARDSSVANLNYDQCFTRDFVTSALVFLALGRTEIVRDFLRLTLALQNQERQFDCFNPGLGLMPASFKVETQGERELVVPDFGEHAIARVVPIDSCFWWLLLLRAYSRATGSMELAHSPEFQAGIRKIIDVSLRKRFDFFPTLLVPDGSFMIDRRMGVYGYPLEIQALFYAALRAAEELLIDAEGERGIQTTIRERLGQLAYHVRQYYWLDRERLNEIYRYSVEEFGHTATNWLNIYPDSIPAWVTKWLPEAGGYFVGNLGPARMDFRFFSQGNLLTIFTSLADDRQSQELLEVIETCWPDLIAQMPMKICFPALEDRDWQLETGWDRKNLPWSYHNSGSWPVLLWLLVAVMQKLGRTDLAEKAMFIAAERLPKDNWPEYYDGARGRLIGREARKLQTWTIAGFFLAQMLLENPNCIDFLLFEARDDSLLCDISARPLTTGVDVQLS